MKRSAMVLAWVALLLCGREARASEAAAAGVSWTVPKGWTAEPDRPMRVATYRIPAVAGDSEGAECGVFYFGPRQGGDVETNIERWTSQFEGRPKPIRSTQKAGGLDVTQLQVSGTYLAGAPMAAATTRKENYRLLGAIVAAPEGSVFFKLTGPAKTVASAKAGFEGLVASLKRR